MSEILDLRFLTKLAFETLRDPRQGAETALRLAPPRPALWLAFSLMITLSLMMGEVVTLIAAPPEAGPLTGQSALALGLLQAAFLFLMVFAVTHIGRGFGGTGTFDGALALITWLQFVFFLLQLLQLVLLLIAPPLAAIVTILAIGLFLWVLVNFITVLHGFQSVGMVFVMTIVSFIGILFALSIVLTILGVTLDTGAMPQGTVAQ
ncbi:YIP1 family protein [Gymnodinialimonas sp.]